jgi:hypothetical protein
VPPGSDQNPQLEKDLTMSERNMRKIKTLLMVEVLTACATAQAAQFEIAKSSPVKKVMYRHTFALLS